MPDQDVPAPQLVAPIVIDDSNGLSPAEVQELVRRIKTGDFAALDLLAKSYDSLFVLWSLARFSVKSVDRF